MDELENEAIQTDVYIDRLLASRFDGPVPVPDADGTLADPDGTLADGTLPEEADVRATAELLRRTIVRFHPSFRFEEGLAARLRTEGRSPEPHARGRLIPFPRPADHSTDRAADGPVLPIDRRGRGLLVGGAIASGVSIASIAGAVLVWRRTRTAPGGHVSEQVV